MIPSTMIPSITGSTSVGVVDPLKASDPLHGMRDGEPLELALADAETKARTFREQALISIGLAEKWEAVATQLRAARELARLPASAPKSTAHPVTRTVLGRARKPDGFWLEQVKKAVGEYLNGHSQGPSKNAVIRHIMEAHPGAAKTSLYHVVNKAVDDGVIKFRGPDCLYLPEHDPVALAAAS